MKVQLANSLFAALASVGVLLGPSPVLAEGLSADQLLINGDRAYNANCVRGSKYYFALIQKFPDRVGPNAQQKLLSLIAACEAYPLGQPGNESKFDAPGATSCTAYAEIAVVEARAAAAVPACRAPGGTRWSQSVAFHFSWCMANDVSREQIRKERDERRKFLDGCAFK